MKKIIMVIGAIFVLSLLVSTAVATPVLGAKTYENKIKSINKFKNLILSKSKSIVGAIGGFLWWLVSFIPVWAFYRIFGYPLSLFLAIELATKPSEILPGSLIWFLYFLVSSNPLVYLVICVAGGYATM